jgi:hypothetical protein
MFMASTHDTDKHADQQMPGQQSMKPCVYSLACLLQSKLNIRESYCCLMRVIQAQLPYLATAAVTAAV